jgi:hypothetical protein
MKYLECPEEEDTHVRVPDTDYNQNYANFLSVTLGEVYEILRNTERGFEGEEMIKNDIGHYVCSFSIGLDIEWLKETI